MLNPLQASAQQLAAAIRNREITSVEVVEAHIQHIQRRNTVLNAVVETRFEQARLEAQAADIAVLSGQPLPALHGVPCTTKENFALKGFRQVSGQLARRDFVADTTAPAIQKMQAAGLIILGTTNTPELCMWMETNNLVYGRTRNPYNPAHTVGGSSGGEGAIIGAGASPVGLGADVGGSIRFPAFFNGVFGHKPTPHYIPNDGQHPLPVGKMNEHCVTGPLARRAEDLWPLLQVLADQPFKGDPHTAKVRRVFTGGTRKIAADLRQAQGQAAQFLQAQPLPEWPELRQAFQIWGAAMRAAEPTPFAQQMAVKNWPMEVFKVLRGQAEHTVPALALAAVELLPMSVGKYLKITDTLKQRFIDLLGDDGVLLYPPYSRAAPKHNAPLLTPFDFVYCGLFNALGFPSSQVPLGLNAQGLPLGTQVVAAPHQDALCVATALKLEQQFGGWTMPV